MSYQGYKRNNAYHTFTDEENLKRRIENKKELLHDIEQQRAHAEKMKALKAANAEGGFSKDADEKQENE